MNDLPKIAARRSVPLHVLSDLHLELDGSEQFVPPQASADVVVLSPVTPCDKHLSLAPRERGESPLPKRRSPRSLRMLVNAMSGELP